MAFWILVALLVAAVTFAITWPLMRSAPASSTTADADADVAVYKDQLGEVTADEARGALASEEAKGARLEIARRLLRSSQQHATWAAKPRSDRLVPVISAMLSVALPVISLALYLAY